MTDPDDFQWACERGFRDAGTPGNHYTVDDDHLTIYYGEEAIDNFDPDKHAWIEVHGPWCRGMTDGLYQQQLADIVMAQARAFHGYNGDPSKVEAGVVKKLADALNALVTETANVDAVLRSRDEARALLNSLGVPRLTEGGD